jgi:hypothetical protein
VRDTRLGWDNVDAWKLFDGEGKKKDKKKKILCDPHSSDPDPLQCCIVFSLLFFSKKLNRTNKKENLEASIVFVLKILKTILVTKSKVKTDNFSFVCTWLFYSKLSRHLEYNNTDIVQNVFCHVKLNTCLCFLSLDKKILDWMLNIE